MQSRNRLSPRAFLQVLINRTSKFTQLFCQGQTLFPNFPFLCVVYFFFVQRHFDFQIIIYIIFHVSNKYLDLCNVLRCNQFDIWISFLSCSHYNQDKDSLWFQGELDQNGSTLFFKAVLSVAVHWQCFLDTSNCSLTQMWTCVFSASVYRHPFSVVLIHPSHRDLFDMVRSCDGPN